MALSEDAINAFSTLYVCVAEMTSRYGSLPNGNNRHSPADRTEKMDGGMREEPPETHGFHMGRGAP